MEDCRPAQLPNRGESQKTAFARLNQKAPRGSQVVWQENMFARRKTIQGRSCMITIRQSMIVAGLTNRSILNAPARKGPREDSQLAGECSSRTCGRYVLLYQACADRIRLLEGYGCSYPTSQHAPCQRASSVEHCKCGRYDYLRAKIRQTFRRITCSVPWMERSSS